MRRTLRFQAQKAFLHVVSQSTLFLYRIGYTPGRLAYAYSRVAP